MAGADCVRSHSTPSSPSIRHQQELLASQSTASILESAAASPAGRPTLDSNSRRSLEVMRPSMSAHYVARDRSSSPGYTSGVRQSRMSSSVGNGSRSMRDSTSSVSSMGFSQRAESHDSASLSASIRSNASFWESLSHEPAASTCTSRVSPRHRTESRLQMWNRATSASAAVQHTAALSRLSRTSTGSNSGRLTGSGPLTGTAFSETRSLTGTNPRRPGLRVRGGDGQPQLVRSFSLPAPRLQASLYPGEASPLRTLSDPCRVSSALLEAADRRTKSRARIPRSRSAHVLGSPGVEELWRQAMCRVIYVRPGTCTGWRFEAPGHRLAAESPRGVDSQDSQQPSADVARRQADGAAAQEDAGNAGRVAGLRGGARLTAQGDAEAGIGLGAAARSMARMSGSLGQRLGSGRGVSSNPGPTCTCQSVGGNSPGNSLEILGPAQQRERQQQPQSTGLHQQGGGSSGSYSVFAWAAQRRIMARRVAAAHS